MALSITPLNEIKSLIRLGIYGSPGVGKTTLGAQIATLYPNPVMMDFENSSEVIRGTDLESKLSIIPKSELGDANQVLKFIQDIGKTDHELLIIDSVSSMNETFLMGHMKKQSGRDRHIALFQDFRKIKNVMVEMFHTLIDSPVHVILIFHEKEIMEVKSNQPTGKVLALRPMLPPETQKSIERLLNELFYLEVKSGLTKSQAPTRNIIVDSQGKILAKNRQNLGVSEIENPNWKDIYNGN